MEQQRALTELEHNHGVDVVWSMTSAEREARLLPVRIGIDKGLMGWRIALLPKSQQRRLKDAHSLADLHQLRATGKFSNITACLSSPAPVTRACSAC